MSIVVDPSQLRAGVLRPPLSKSDAQRALVLAHVLGLPHSHLLSPAALATAPDDVRKLTAGLAVLAENAEGVIDCGEGGAPLRFLLGQAAVTPGFRGRLIGSERLGERPHEPLFHALRAALGSAGFEVSVAAEGFWPVRVQGVTAVPERARFTVDGSKSSQYVSSLLLAAAALAHREKRPWTVALTGALASGGYLSMTLDWLTKFGFEVARDGQEFTLSGFKLSRFAESTGKLHRSPPPIPGDWSSLGYLLLAAWAAKGTVTGVDPTAEHPDRAILTILKSVGLTLRFGPDGVRVEGVPQRGVTARGATYPDLLPTLAAFACVLPAPSVLSEVSILRHKESDRLAAIEDLVAGAGGSTRLAGDELTIEPPTAVRPFSLATRSDHRVAMSGALLAVLARVEVTLDDGECVAKSFPDFWEQLSAIGVVLRR